MTKLIKKSLLGLLTILLFSCGSSTTKEPMSLYSELDRNAPVNTLSKKEKQKGWELLFNGTTHDGWHGYNLKEFPDCWIIQDGAFTMTSGGGTPEQENIITNKKYRSFALSLEYKLTKGANSGVLFQVAEDPQYKYPYETGPEFQVIDHESWPDPLEDWQINGANYGMYPPVSKPYKPIGEWNQILLVVDGNNVTQILNGKVVVTYEKNSEEWKKLRDTGIWSTTPGWGKYDEGYISLQNHGTKVFYRNIKLKKL